MPGTDEPSDNFCTTSLWKIVHIENRAGTIDFTQRLYDLALELITKIVGFFKPRVQNDEANELCALQFIGDSNRCSFTDRVMLNQR